MKEVKKFFGLVRRRSFSTSKRIPTPWKSQLLRTSSFQLSSNCYSFLLPQEILILIFSFLEPKDWLKLQFVCKSFYFIIKDDNLWKNLESKFLSYPNNVSKIKSDEKKVSEDNQEIEISLEEENKLYRPNISTISYRTQYLSKNWEIVASLDESVHLKNSWKKAEHYGKVYSLSWSVDGSKISSISQDGRILIWNNETKSVLSRISLHTSYMMTISFSPDNKHVAVGGLDNTVSIYDIELGRNITFLNFHSGYVAWYALFQYLGRNFF